MKALRRPLKNIPHEGVLTLVKHGIGAQNAERAPLRWSRHERRPTRSRSAFTLIEVLATMVLLAIVLPVTMRGVSIALGAAGNAKRTADAASLLQSKLNELVITKAWSAGGTTGDFGADFPGYTWTLQSNTRDYGLTELSLTTTWTEQSRPKALTVSTLVSDVGNGSASSGGTAP